MSTTPNERPTPAIPLPGDAGAHQALKIEAIHESSEYVMMCMPAADHLLADENSGAIHIGAITALMDSAMGFSIRARIQEPIAMATLDLKVDNIRPSQKGAQVFAKASCFVVGAQVAYCRAVAYEDDESDPVAAATGTFMLNTPGPVYEGMNQSWANIRV